MRSTALGGRSIGVDLPVFDQDLVIDSNESLTLYGETLKFAPGKRLIVHGALNAEGTTFTASNPTDGWGGIRYQPGSTGLLQDATVEGVDSMIGNSPAPTVRVENADVTLEGVVLDGGTGAGLFVVGNQADVVVQPSSQRLSQILSPGGNGVVAGNHADVYLDDVTIFESGSVGVYTTTFGDIYLRETEIDLSGQNGARAHGEGRIIFGFPGRNAGANDQNNFITSSGANTLYADAGGTVYGGGQGIGFDDNYRHSWFRRGVINANEHHARIYAADVIAECNYWNDGQTNAPGPDLTFVDTQNGGIFDGDPFLASPPNVSTTCGVLEITGETNHMARTSMPGTDTPSTEQTAGGPPAGMMPERWWAIADGIENKDPAVGIGHIVSAIQRARTPAETRRAYEVAAQLGSDEAHPGLEGFLFGQSRRTTHRPYALEARAAIHYGTGRVDEAQADADVLIAEYGETEHGRQGWLVRYMLASDAKDRGGAEAALAEVEARWPDYDAAVLREATAGLSAASALPRTLATRAGMKPSPPTVQAASETALPEATELRAPYPNPTTGGVTIPLALAEGADVTLTVTNALGQRVRQQAARSEVPGVYAYALDTAELAPGVYVVQVTVASAAATTQHQQTFTVVR